MKKLDKMFAGLQILYAKRSVLDTQIQGLEASLVADVAVTVKPATTSAEKPAKNPTTKKQSPKK